jgi:hypothetical protein
MHLVLTSRVSAKSARHATRRILALLAGAGFDDETSVRALRAIMAYMMGAQILQDGAVTMAQGLPGDPAEARVEADLDPAETPHVAALFDELTRPDPEAEFELGLEMLLSALDRLPRGGR